MSVSRQRLWGVGRHGPSFPIAATSSGGYRPPLTWRMTSVPPSSQELAGGGPVWLLPYGCWLCLAMSPLKDQARNGHSPVSRVICRKREWPGQVNSCPQTWSADMLAGTQHLPIKGASGTGELVLLSLHPETPQPLCPWLPHILDGSRGRTSPGKSRGSFTGKGGGSAEGKSRVEG